MARRRPKWKVPEPEAGKKVTVYLDSKSLKIYQQLENKSAFFQLALHEAVGVIQWALMKKAQPEKYYDTGNVEELIPQFNETYPLDPLTQKRKEKDQECENSAPKQELW